MTDTDSTPDAEMSAPGPGSDVLRRINAHWSMMAPHQKSREQGKLLREAGDAIQGLRLDLINAGFNLTICRENNAALIHELKRLNTQAQQPHD